MHPETVMSGSVRRLKCPGEGCGFELSQTPLVEISVDDEVRFCWRCPHCHKVTELLVHMSDSCWTLDRILMPTVRDG